MIEPENPEMLVTLTVSQLKALLLEWLNMALDERLAKIDFNGSPKEFLTAKELAKTLKVPLSWVRYQTHIGAIPHEKLGKYVRFNLDGVLSWYKFNGK